MSFRRILFGLVAASLLFLPARGVAAQARAPQVSTPAEVVRAFYEFHFAHDMGFDEETLRARRAWLTPELYDLLLYERRRETPRDEVPYMNGDPFTDSQEYPKSFRVGRAGGSRRSPSVEVLFFWTDGNRVIERKKYSVKLRGVRGRWRIADVVSDNGYSLLASLVKLKREDDAARARKSS